MASEHNDRDALYAQYEELSRQVSSLTRQTTISSTFSDTSLFTNMPSPGSTRTTNSSPTRERHHQRRRSCSHAPIVPSLSKATTMPASLRQDFAYGPSPALSRESSQEDDSHHATTQQMKIVLIDLLNCESVKHDIAWRTWVQARLMDAEIDLRDYRRRRSSVCVDEHTLNSITSHLEHHANGLKKHTSF